MSTKVSSKLAALLGLSAILTFGATQAMAHAKLVTAVPAVKSSGAAPAAIVLHFDDDLEMKFSSFKVTDIDGKVVAIKASPAPDSKSLAATPVAPLAPGLYTVSWTAASTEDGHKMTGKYSFTVK